MSDSAVQLAFERILAANEEGFRADVYDDADGRPIVTQGQPTIGYGCRCRGWSTELAAAVLTFQLGEAEAPLMQEAWYRNANAARQSVFVEIAFNQGDAGLEDGYPNLIAAASDEDWARAGAECTVREPALQARYARLAKILVTGEGA